MPSDFDGSTAMAVRGPVGVVAAIAPWNTALILSGRAIADPLVLGNTVVLKPSEESPWSGGLVWAEIFDEAGLPPGVLHVVTHAPGDASSISSELVAHPWVRRINFTGSTATGRRRLAEAAGRHLKRVVLELRGQNPFIILADADLDYAVDAAAYGAFLHQGKICMCARRPIAEEFLVRFAEKAAGLAKAPLPCSSGPGKHDLGLGSPAVPVWLIAPCSRYGLGGCCRRRGRCVDL